MQLAETVKLYPPKKQREWLHQTMQEYIDTVNNLVSMATNGQPIAKFTSKDVKANLPSALKNQCVRDAKSVVRKYDKACKIVGRKTEKLAKQGKKVALVAALPVLKKPCCYINNQNFKVKGANIEFPVLVDGKSTRLSVPTKITERQKAIFSAAKLGTMRIVVKNNSLVAQIVYESKEPEEQRDGNVMGVDLGIKCPAVSKCSDGSVKFYGNGRKNKAMRRHFAAKRNALQKEKHMDAVKRAGDKEQRIMKDIDHKISRAIVDEAVTHHVKTIKLEQLSKIRSATRKSRKNNHSLHTWSFYRLAQFIEYKAKLAGITVEYVNPAYTSQRCPNCGDVHHAQDRNYTCACGFHAHRDIVGAINICNSTELVGNRQAA